MFGLRKTLKLVTTLPLLVAIVATGFVPVTRASDPCVGDGVKPKPACAASSRCCCKATAGSRACCCRRDNDSPPPPPATPNDSARALKWVPWVDAPSRIFVIVARQRASFAHGGGFYTSLQRSVQTLLCIWRI